MSQLCTTGFKLFSVGQRIPLSTFVNGDFPIITCPPPPASPFAVSLPPSPSPPPVPFLLPRLPFCLLLPFPFCCIFRSCSTHALKPPIIYPRHIRNQISGVRSGLWQRHLHGRGARCLAQVRRNAPERRGLWRSLAVELHGWIGCHRGPVRSHRQVGHKTHSAHVDGWAFSGLFLADAANTRQPSKSDSLFLSCLGKFMIGLDRWSYSMFSEA